MTDKGPARPLRAGPSPDLRRAPGAAPMGSERGAGAGAASSITNGTKPPPNSGPSSVPPRYACRQIDSSDREIPHRRAVADPCRCARKLSSTMRILSSSDQCRRRPTSSAVKSSIGMKTEEHDIRPCLMAIQTASADCPLRRPTIRASNASHHVRQRKWRLFGFQRSRMAPTRCRRSTSDYF